MPSSARSLEEALDLAHRCIDACDAAPSETGISFNGGKDSIVMMELLLERWGLPRVRQCRLFLFGEDDEFEEVAIFRASYLQDRLPGAVLETVPARLGMKAGLALLQEKYHLQAVMMGTRSTDPCGKYQTTDVAPTTEGWAPMVRYCPCFYFTYAQIWELTLSRKYQYCPLYALGYTSLGSRALTIPNPSLATTAADSSSSTTTPAYYPAWLLKDGEKERDCRRSKS